VLSVVGESMGTLEGVGKQIRVGLQRDELIGGKETEAATPTRTTLVSVVNETKSSGPRLTKLGIGFNP
jgi:hypothetical protein